MIYDFYYSMSFQGFTHTISKNNQKALDRICEVLDEKVIRQQAEQGVLDFKAYSSFIIQLMAKSCAPIRDEEINKLNEIDDVVQTFRRILEVMDLMKLDMANCLLDAARREVITHSVEYEKLKFKEFLKAYPGKNQSFHQSTNFHQSDFPIQKAIKMQTNYFVQIS